MKRITTILSFLMLVCMGAGAQITVTPSNGHYWKNGSQSSDAWAPQWKSTATATDGSTPLLIFTGESGMNTANGDIYSNQTYTLTAPDGYYITGYTFNGTATGADITITPSGQSGTVVSSGTSLATPLAVSLFSKSTTFTLSNDGVAGHFTNLSLVVNIVPLTVNIANTASGNLPSDFGSFSGQTFTTSGVSGLAGVTITASTGLTIGDETVSGNHYGKCFKFVTAAASTNYTVTMTVPSGYYILGYTLACSANTKDAPHTLTSADGTVSVVASAPPYNSPTGPKVFEVSGLKTQSTSFTINTASKANTLYVPKFVINVAKESDFVSVNYKVNFGGEQVATASDTQLTGSAPSLPASAQRDFCTYTYYSDEERTEVLNKITPSTSIVYVNATWSAPFELSSDIDEETSWYYLNLKPGETHVPTYNSGVDPNVVMSESERVLGNENQQWAFVGDPYTGITIYNRAAGSSVKLGTSANPSSDGNTGGNTRVALTASPTYSVWVPKPSSHGTNGFFLFLKVGDNQYAANLRSKNFAFWTGDFDAGSTFNAELVVANYYNLVKSEVLPFLFADPDNIPASPTASDLSTTIGSPFGLNAAAANTIYMTYGTQINSQTFTLSEYNAIKTAFENGIIYPRTGYYRLRNYSYNTAYLGQNSNVAKFVSGDNNSNTIVYLTKNDENNTYTIQLQGKYIQTPTKSTQVTTGNDAVWFTPTIGAPGIASWNAGGGDYGNLHIDVSGKAVGWEATGIANNPASYFYISNATYSIVNLNDGKNGKYYATLNLPFDVTLSEGTDVYTMVLNGTTLEATEVTDRKVPANTPVMLKSTSSTTTATIRMAGDAFTTSNENDLTGTNVQLTVDGANDYFLGIYETVVGFYHWDQNALNANRAYLPASKVGDTSRGFAIKWNDDEVTGIRAIDNGKQAQNNGAFYDLSGRRVENPQHGLYIVNGRVVVIK